MTVDHPAIIAVRNCRHCGGGLEMWFTMMVSNKPSVITPEDAEERAQEYAQNGMTPSNGWEVQPEIHKTMVRLELIEPA
jgi:hypothetical protein